MFSRCGHLYRGSITKANEGYAAQRMYKLLRPVLEWGNDDITTEVSQKKLVEKVPIITCRRSEFNFYKGQTFPKYKPIPLASGGWHHYKSKGDYFVIHPNVEPFEEVDGEQEPGVYFDQYGLNPDLVRNLHEMNITHPTPIQRQGIPTVLSRRNTCLAAETGCGKTLAYLLPLLDQIVKWKRITNRRFNTPLGLILTPSRELAIQIGGIAEKLTMGLDVKVKAIVGGRTKRMTRNPIMLDVDLVIGSLGVISKLATTRVYSMEMVRHVVLDEADALFHETFCDKLQHFLKKIPLRSGQLELYDELPRTAQLTLVAATDLSKQPLFLSDLFNTTGMPTHLATPKLNRILIPQKFIRLGLSEKPAALLKLVKKKTNCNSPVIVFSNSSATSDWVDIFLRQFNVRSVCLNGQAPMTIRRGKFSEFQNGGFDVLSTTNAGSRGLDTTMVRHVINYNFPLDSADYINRCGRTGRFGSPKDCKVTNFIATKQEIKLTQKIEKATRKLLPIPRFTVNSMSVEEAEAELQELKGQSQLSENLNDNFRECDKESQQYMIPHG